MLASWRNWRERHQHPVSRALHYVAIPLLPAAGALVAVQLVEGAWSLWWRPALLIVLSYVMQGIGHRIEGNDVGEVILIKRLLGIPYTAISPRYRRTDACPGTPPSGATAPTHVEEQDA